jgi:hypothetical protein
MGQVEGAQQKKKIRRTEIVFVLKYKSSYKFQIHY